MAEKFKYRPLDPTKHEIRLCAIFPGSRLDELKGHLFHIPLPANPLGSSSENHDHEYEALSYCWEDAKGVSRSHGYVELDGRRLSITPNLDAALRRLRSSTVNLVIWIDAICINQLDLGERSDQVKRMRDIYSRAKTVRVWLGESYDNSSYAFEVLRELAILSATNSSEATIRKNIVILSIGKEMHVKALVLLFQRVYWERVWIIQEIAVANALTVHCGADCLPWLDFENATLILQQQAALILSALGDPSKMEILSFKGPSIVLGAREAVRTADSPLSSLYRCLLNFDRSQATDPRDKVYALAGISTARDDPDFVIDYKFSEREVYTSAVQHMLSMGSLQIICSARAGSRIPDLPSWVPDWTVKLDQTSGSIRKTFESMELYYPTTASISIDGKILTASGVRVDLVRHHTETWNSQPYDCLSAIASFHMWREFVNDNKGEDIAHQKSLVRAVTFDISLKDPSLTEATILGALGSYAKRFLSKELLDPRLDECINTWRRTKLTSWETMYQTDDNANVKFEETFLNAIMETALGRCLFISGEGKLGTVTNNVREGDIICYIIGSGSPMVLREREGGDGFVLVGQAWVDGLDPGDTLDELKARRYEPEEFCIW